GYTLWDAQTGKLRKQSQMFSDTGLKVTSLQGSALLGDSRTLCIVVNQYILNGNPKVDNSNKYYGISIDIETGEMKASAQNIRAFYAIPGSTNVIALGKDDVNKIDFNAYFLFDGLQLNKRFQYQLKLGQAYLNFNQGSKFFLHDTKAGGTLSIVDINTGKEECKALGEDGWGVPANISNNKEYILADGGGGYMMMYSVAELCGITSVISKEKVQPMLSPIPTSDILTINDSKIDDVAPISSVEISDNLGNVLNANITIFRQDNHSLVIDVSALSNGTYTLKINQHNTSNYYSIIIVK
ncbi:MAG: T9SS type A sorting domain-containing protein, partial [Candidatus Kapabacteria bacterium]|nr:T9SS type A sorting domain-containing protein [Candidatus Kapabacteria bacterium]